eukprot:6102663-Lingulodinium_polyedra.AAC.1
MVRAGLRKGTGCKGWAAAGSDQTKCLRPLPVLNRTWRSQAIKQRAPAILCTFVVLISTSSWPSVTPSSSSQTGPTPAHAASPPLKPNRCCQHPLGGVNPARPGWEGTEGDRCSRRRSGKRSEQRSESDPERSETRSGSPPGGLEFRTRISSFFLGDTLFCVTVVKNENSKNLGNRPRGAPRGTGF